MENVQFVCRRCDSINPCYMNTLLKYSKILHPTDCPFGGRSAIWQKVVNDDVNNKDVDYRELKSNDNEDLLLER